MVNSSIKTSMQFSRKPKKILIIHLWKVASALQRPKGILLYVKVPQGHVKVVFSWSFWCNVNLKVATVSIQEVVVMRFSNKPLQHLINERKGKWSFWLLGLASYSLCRLSSYSALLWAPIHYFGS